MISLLIWDLRHKIVRNQAVDGVPATVNHANIENERNRD